jgi:hypothetical protein
MHAFHTNVDAFRRNFMHAFHTNVDAFRRNLKLMRAHSLVTMVTAISFPEHARSQVRGGHSSGEID